MSIQIGVADAVIASSAVRSKGVGDTLFVIARCGMGILRGIEGKVAAIRNEPHGRLLVLIPSKGKHNALRDWNAIPFWIGVENSGVLCYDKLQPSHAKFIAETLAQIEREALNSMAL